MNTKANILLLLAAAIWGFAFVAQRVGMEHLGPFTFNGIRFALGGLSLLPLLWFLNGNAKKESSVSTRKSMRSALGPGLLTGVVLFTAASLQQIGLVYTTAGKAAFVTCLYIVLVPIAGVFLHRGISKGAWGGATLATIGLYFLCVKGNFDIAKGDLLELAGAVFWTVHIMLIDHFSRKLGTLELALVQFMTCSVLSLITALFSESFVWESIWQAGIPIIYGGVFSVGVAYTLQIVGQKTAAPAQAAILLSMETVFAVLGGYLFLKEQLGAREVFGCALMMVGMLLSQLAPSKKYN